MWNIPGKLDFILNSIKLLFRNHSRPDTNNNAFTNSSKTLTYRSKLLIICAKKLLNINNIKGYQMPSFWSYNVFLSQISDTSDHQRTKKITPRYLKYRHGKIFSLWPLSSRSITVNLKRSSFKRSALLVLFTTV